MTAPYGGQWKDPSTGQFNQAGYEKYLYDINKKYLENLNAQGQIKAGNQWAGAYGVTPGKSATSNKPVASVAPELPAAEMPKPTSNRMLTTRPGQKRMGGMQEGTGPMGSMTPIVNKPSLPNVRGLPYGGGQGDAYRPDTSLASLTRPNAGVRTEGDERARRELEQFLRSLGIAGGGVMNRPTPVAASPSVRDGIIRGNAPGGAQLPPFYPTNVTGGGANMQAPSYDWMETNPPNQWLYGYGSSPPPVGGWEPVTPGREFPGDPGVAGWHIAPDETPAPPLPSFGGGPALPVQSGGGGGGSGGGGGGYGGWGDYSLEGAPDYWTGKAAGNSPDQILASIANMLIGTGALSEEDSSYLADNISKIFPDVFGSYNRLTNDSLTPPVPGEPGTNEQREYASVERAQKILDAITKMTAAGGMKSGVGSEVPAPIAWLQSIADLYKDSGISGATEMPTATNLQGLLAGLDPLAAETEGSGPLSAYKELARMIMAPFRSMGELWPRTKGANGQMAFGQPNRTIF